MPSIAESIVVPEPGRNLPPVAFTSPEVFELEQRKIFTTSWVHVADLGDIAAIGSYITAHIGRTPVIVLRDRTGELRAFLNACRHRGARAASRSEHCESRPYRSVPRRREYSDGRRGR